MRELNSMEDFKRDIVYQVLLQEDESILLTGTMRDCFHDIEVEIVVDAESLVITGSRATFRKAPSQYCDRAEDRFALLKGVVIGKGLSRSLSAALGGCEGCGNLRTLLTGLLPLAMNVKASAGISDEKEMLGMIQHHLQGTCVGYPVAEE
mgnify:FL=1